MSESISAIYCLDSSAFIDLDKQYGPEFFPDLWEQFAALAAGGRWLFTEKVVPEVQDPAPAAWIKQHTGAVRRVEAVHEDWMRRIMESHAGLVDPNSTREVADPWIIALALVEQHTPSLLTGAQAPVVVTSERPRKSPTSRPKIPDVCSHYKVACCDILGLFRREKWKFRLDATR